MNKSTNKSIEAIVFDGGNHWRDPREEWQAPYHVVIIPSGFHNTGIISRVYYGNGIDKSGDVLVCDKRILYDAMGTAIKDLLEHDSKRQPIKVLFTGNFEDHYKIQFVQLLNWYANHVENISVEIYGLQPVKQIILQKNDDNMYLRNVPPKGPLELKLV